MKVNSLNSYESVWQLVADVFCRDCDIDDILSRVKAPDVNRFEQEVASELYSLAHSLHGIVFRDLYIPCDAAGNVTQVDCVVLLPDRILIVECKDCNGVVDCESVLADNQKPYWKQTKPDGTQCWLYSPVVQNMLHLRAVSHLTGVTYPKCFSLILFPDRVDLRHVPEITESCAVLRLGQLADLNFRPIPSKVFSSYRFASLVKSFEKCQATDFSVREQHLSNVKQATHGRPGVIVPTSCPKCGSKLQHRSGRTEFLGCSMYPLCDYTFDLEV